MSTTEEPILTPKEVSTLEADTVARKDPETRKRKDIYLWTGAHSKVLHYIKQNFTIDEVAAKVGLTVETVKFIRNTPKFRLKARKVEEKIQTQLTDAIVRKLSRSEVVDKALDKIIANVPAAADTIVEIMMTGKTEDRIRLDAAKEILALFESPKLSELTSTRDRVLSPEELLSAQRTVTELLGTIKRLDNQNSPFLLSGTKGSSFTDDGSQSASTNRQEVSSE